MTVARNTETRPLYRSVVVALLLTGCSLDEELVRSQETVQVARTQMNQAREAFQEPRLNEQSQIVGKPWVVGKPVDLSPDVTLPKVLRESIKTTLIFRERKATLPEVASRVALAASIPVRVLPDALLAAHHFLPRLNGVENSGQTQANVQLPMVSGTFVLAKVLDIIAAQYDVHWRFQDNAIEFFRTQTQVFDVRVLTLSAESEMRLGRASTSDAQGFQSSSRTTLTLDRQPLLDAIKQRLEPFLSRAAIVSAQAGSLTSIVVTDTPVALKRIAAYLESINRTMNQRVRLVFEEMTVTQKQGQQQGVDWSLAFARGLVSVGTGTTRSDPTNTALAATAGNDSFQASLTLRALAEYANVLRHTVVPVVTLNRRPVTHAVRSTFTYVDQVQAFAASGDGKRESSVSHPGVAVSQKRETTGSFLTLVPDVQDDGQILLSIAYDNTVAMPLKALHFGGAENTYQVQQLTVNGSGTVQQVALRAGQPVLIAGFEERQEQNEGSHLGAGLPRATGGFDSVGQKQRMTLIFVTAQVEEGL